MGANVSTGSQEIVLFGPLDAHTAPDVRDALHSAIDHGRGDLLVDLGDVHVVDSTGLGLLLGAHRRAGRQGRRLVLRNVAPAVQRLLRLTRLNRILTIEPEASTT